MLDLEMESIKEKVENLVIEMALTTDQPFDFVDLFAKKNDIDIDYCKDEILSSLSCSMCGDRVTTNQWGVCVNCVSHSKRVA